MKIFPSVSLPGNAYEAATHYAKIFNAKVDIVRFGDLPDFPHDMPGKDAIARATLIAKETLFALCDDLNFDGGFGKGVQSRITIQTDKAEDAKKFFDALNVDAQNVFMAFDKTSFADGFGMLKDKYGIEWEIAGNVLDVRKKK
ncbi:MAG: VOC family protein [Clostridiales bacterium]|jgi:PhnB protein|nr:VOC family protein [Clostridiales bacterium]